MIPKKLIRSSLWEVQSTVQRMRGDLDSLGSRPINWDAVSQSRRDIEARSLHNLLYNLSRLRNQIDVLTDEVNAMVNERRARPTV